VERIAEKVLVTGCYLAALPLALGCSGAIRGSAGNADGGAPADDGAVVFDAAADDGGPGPGDSGDPFQVPNPSPASGSGGDGGLPAIDCGTSDAQGLVSADTTFATAFLSPAIAQAGGIGVNAVVSSYSVSNAMMMVDVGAAGETDSQIKSVLSLPGNGATEAPAYAGLACALEADGSSNGQSFAVASSLWGQQGTSFETPFLNVLAQGYGAPLQTVDFASDPADSTTTINTWVSRATQGNIPSLLGPDDITNKTRLVLVNAVYFKGTWATGFDPSMTAPRPFTLADGSQTMITTMSGTINASTGRTSTLLVLELPYKGNTLAMDVLMPQAASADLAAFESTLTPAALGSALASLGAPYGYIVDLPKFSFTTHVELASVLAGLGMTDVFQDGVADLSGMDGARDLSVSAVVQQAMVEVDEQGTVAAAATGVSVCSCSVVTSPPTVLVDRPFVFLVRDLRNGAIVFMGQVVNPGQ
jgi:serpin B